MIVNGKKQNFLKKNKIKKEDIKHLKIIDVLKKILAKPKCM